MKRITGVLFEKSFERRSRSRGTVPKRALSESSCETKDRVPFETSSEVRCRFWGIVPKSIVVGVNA